MSGFNLFDTEVSARIVLTLLHFLWQGLLIAIVVGVVNQILRRATATGRYLLSFTAMALMLVCLPVTFWYVSPEGGLAQSRELSNFSTEESTSLPLRRSDSGSVDMVAPAELFVNAPETVSVPEVVKPGSSSPLRWEIATPYLVSIYLVGVVLMLGRLLFAFYGGERLRRQSEPLADQRILNALSQQATRMRLRIAPAVAVCHRISSPIIVGVLKPTILLPIAILTELTPAQIEAVLAHELAHLRRWDHVANLFQRLVETLLFFHPAVWYVSRIVSNERENCCDDLVLQFGADASGYAETLLRVAEMGQLSSVKGPAVSLAADGGKPTQLRQRVLRVMNIESDSSFRASRFGTLMIVAMLGLASAGIWSNAFAVSPSDESTQVSPDDVGRLIEKMNQHAVAVPRGTGAFSGSYVQRQNGAVLSEKQIRQQLVDLKKMARAEIELIRNAPDQQDSWREYLKQLRAEARSNGRDSLLSDEQLIEESIQEGLRGLRDWMQADHQQRIDLEKKVRAEREDVRADPDRQDIWRQHLRELRTEARADGRDSLLSDEQLIEEAIQEQIRGRRMSLQIDSEQRLTKYAFDIKFDGDLMCARYVTEQLNVDGKDAEYDGLVQTQVWGTDDFRYLQTSADGLSRVGRIWDKPNPLVHSSQNLDWKLNYLPFPAIQYQPKMLRDSYREKLSDGRNIVFVTLEADVAIWRIGLIDDHHGDLHSFEIFNRTTGLPMRKQQFSNYQQINNGRRYPFEIVETEVVTAALPQTIAAKVKAGELPASSREVLDAAEMTAANTWEISVSKAAMKIDLDPSVFRYEFPEGVDVSDDRTNHPEDLGDEAENTNSTDSLTVFVSQDGTYRVDGRVVGKTQIRNRVTTLLKKRSIEVTVVAGQSTKLQRVIELVDLVKAIPSTHGHQLKVNLRTSDDTAQTTDPTSYLAKINLSDLADEIETKRGDWAAGEPLLALVTEAFPELKFVRSEMSLSDFDAGAALIENKIATRQETPYDLRAWMSGTTLFFATFEDQVLKRVVRVPNEETTVVPKTKPKRR